MTLRVQGKKKEKEKKGILHLCKINYLVFLFKTLL